MVLSDRCSTLQRRRDGGRDWQGCFFVNVLVGSGLDLELYREQDEYYDIDIMGGLLTITDDGEDVIVQYSYVCM